MCSCCDTGKDLAEEDANFMQYLADNGWEGVVGEDDDATLDDGSSDGAMVEKR